MRSACIEYQSAIRASYDSGFCDMGWFQHSVVYDAIDQWWTKTGACIHAEGGHFEHLLWRCLSVASCHTSQPALLRATNNIWKNTTSLQSHKKSFALHQLVWWHFQVGGASGLQFILFWDNVNSHKYIRIILLKMTFRSSKIKWLQPTSEVDKSVRFWCLIISGFNIPKSLKSVNFWRSYTKKNKKVDVFGTHRSYILKQLAQHQAKC